MIIFLVFIVLRVFSEFLYQECFHHLVKINITNLEDFDLINEDILITLNLKKYYETGLSLNCDDLYLVEKNNDTIISYYIENECGIVDSKLWITVPFIKKDDSLMIDMFYFCNKISIISDSDSELREEHFVGEFINIRKSDCGEYKYFNEIEGKFLKINSVFGGKRDFVSDVHNHLLSKYTTKSVETSFFDTGPKLPYVSNPDHDHIWNFNTDDANHFPPYLEMVFCQKESLSYDKENILDDIFLFIFNSTEGEVLPENMTIFSDLIDKFLFGGKKFTGISKGNESHYHFYEGLTNTASESSLMKGQNLFGWASTERHQHNMNGTTQHHSNLPIYKSMIFATAKNKDIDLENLQEFMFHLSTDIPPKGWVKIDSYNNFYVRGSDKSNVSGGSDTQHHHSYRPTIWPDDFNVVMGRDQTVVVNQILSAPYHTHIIDTDHVSYLSEVQLPYLDLLLIKRKKKKNVLITIGEDIVLINGTSIIPNPFGPVLFISIFLFICVILIMIPILVVIVMVLINMIKNYEKKEQLQKSIDGLVSNALEGEEYQQLEREKKELEEKMKKTLEEKEKLKKDKEEERKKKAILQKKYEKLEKKHEEYYQATTPINLLELDIFVIEDPEKEMMVTKNLGKDSQGVYTVYHARYRQHLCLLRVFNQELQKAFKMKFLRIFSLFEKELKECSRYKHPNIIKYIAYSKPPKVVLLNEISHLGNLKTFALTEKRKSWLQSVVVFQEKLRLCVEIGKGMLYLHNLGVVHNDLRADNIYITDKFIPKIDFAFSSIFLRNYLESHYASPEVVKKYVEDLEDNRKSLQDIIKEKMRLKRSNQDDDDDDDENIDQKGLKYFERDIVKSDVFSYGILLYELITENFDPYQVKKKRIKDIGFKVMNDPNYRPNLNLISNVKGIEKYSWSINLIKMCLYHDPSKRPSFERILSIIQNFNEQFKEEK